MSTLVHSIRRRALVVGLVVASLAGASGSASAAPVVDGSLYGYANSYAPMPTKLPGVVDGSLYGYANSYAPLPTKLPGFVDGSLYGYANSYTPTPKFHKVPKVPQRPKVAVERTVGRCDVPVGTAHAGELRPCE